jgi:hypothetical protein
MTPLDNFLPPSGGKQSSNHIRSKRKPSSTLKFISWNTGNMSILTSLNLELKSALTKHVLLSVNETSSLADLSSLGLTGWRHSNTVSRGLCVYMSESLRCYSTCHESTFSLYGRIALPSVSDYDPLAIGYISAYRSPSIKTREEIQSYFSDMSIIIDSLLETCELIYIAGDLNMFDKRYSISDLKKIVIPPESLPQVISFREFHRILPSENYEHMFFEPTHRPYQKNAMTIAQLDYMLVIHSGKFPRGKSKQLVTKSDHDALVLNVNVPYLAPATVKFTKQNKRYNTDYELLDSILEQEMRSNGISPVSINVDFGYLDLVRQEQEYALSDIKTKSLPKAGKYDVGIRILQNKANKARKNSDMASYHKIVSEIQKLLTTLASRRMDKVTRDKSSFVFHRWASAIIKPCRAEQGKFVMVDKTIGELTDAINDNYTAPDGTTHAWRDCPPFTGDDVSEVRKSLSDTFSFAERIQKLHTVPVFFKKCPNSSANICEKMLDAVCVTGSYPNCLKNSQCDILPARTIFQNTQAYGKALEGYFGAFIQKKYTAGLENMAYREKLSTTALLINEFDVLARNDSMFGFNADLQKAFDRLNRDLVLAAIDNNFVKSVVSSWLDRTDCPYIIYWRGEGHLICRNKWNRGVEPGSVLGPVLFITGLNDRVFFCKSAAKNIFADDSFPLYKNIEDLNSDAAHFINRVYKNQMEIHITGDKALTFSAFGKGASEAPEFLELPCDIGDVRCDKKQTSLKQAGLVFDIDSTGIPICNMKSKIGRLREAGQALKRISRICLSSTAIHLIKTYVLTVMSYAICVWYPNMYFLKNKASQLLRAEANSSGSKSKPVCTNSLEELRYWYYCILNYICYDSLDLMGWSNSSRSLSQDTDTGRKLCALTGMPSLEELYIASCVTHYGHFLNMYKLEIGGLRGDALTCQKPVLKYSERLNRLLYVGIVLKSRVSPLKLLIDNVNALGKDFKKIKISPDISESLLVRFEIEYAQKCKKEGIFYDKILVRNMQRILSLAFFDKLNVNDFEQPKRVADPDFALFTERRLHVKNHLSRFRKSARLGKLITDTAYPGRTCRFKLRDPEEFHATSTQAPVPKRRRIRLGNISQ